MDAGALDSRMAEAIVACPLVGVVQDLEGLGRFLELGDGLGIARILVRMIFDRQFAIRVGDFLGRGVRATPKIS